MEKDFNKFDAFKQEENELVRELMYAKTMLEFCVDISLQKEIKQNIADIEYRLECFYVELEDFQRKMDDLREIALQEVAI
ncbi:hypothetical protein LV469_03055 [Peptoniphilus sp. GNH]|nr:hypothetical protein LV469_03055 [Peptoniphilus sp. GNH]